MDADDVIKQEDCSDGGHEQEQEVIKEVKIIV